ncbi:MAG TPA: hypothetical protein VFG76_06805 [Candidatus Polarisedimenticolia bacterium]|nr:hypothetical protein [Candidatus Polarisedimenticolia bacterium]
MNRLMKFFRFDHLPEHLQEPSRSCAELAVKMDENLTESAEKTAGLRKLLEAKDCFVRARLEETLVVDGAGESRGQPGGGPP